VLDSGGDGRGQSPSRGRVGLTSGCPPAPPAPRPPAPPAPPAPPPPATTLRANTLFALLGSTVNGVFYWSLFSLCLRVLDAAAAGHLALGLSITSPLMILAQLGLRQHYVVRMTTPYNFRDYAVLRGITTMLALLMSVGIAQAFYAPSTVILVGTVGLMKVAENGSDLTYAVHQKHNRLDTIASSIIARCVMGLIAMVAGLWFFESPAPAILGVAASWALVLIAFDMRTVIPEHDARPKTTIKDLLSATDQKPTKERRLTLASESAPLAFAMVIASLIANVPRLYIEHTLGATSLGHFAAVAYFVVPGAMFMSALGQAYMPELASALSARNASKFNQKLTMLLVSASVLGVCGLALSVLAPETLLWLAYGTTDTALSDNLLFVMIIALLTNVAAALSCALTSAKCFSVQLKLQLCTLALISCSVAPFVKTFGVRGALAAWLLGVSFQCLAMAMTLKKQLLATV